MADGSCEFEKAIPMNAIGLFSLHVITAGSYDGSEYVLKTEQSYKKLVTKDNLLKGYILIGDVERAGIYTSLIRDKTPLDTINFELIKQKPQLMAFSKAERKKQLGGAK
jgi:NAD(P)H-nitrite reductase large subunit